MSMTKKGAIKKSRLTIFFSAVVVFILVLGIVVFMNVKNTSDLQAILEESVKSQLLSIAVAAREIIDPSVFEHYNSLEDITADQANFDLTLSRLRALQKNVGAEYIYALKQINGAFYFVFDTDTADNAMLDKYEPSAVHQNAFLGKDTAGVMNLQDEYGTFNTAAVPLWLDGRIVGVVAVDTEDTFLKQSQSTGNVNAIILVTTLGATMVIALYVIYMLLHRVRQMQDRLEQIAHYDAVTGLPNRQFLLEHLQSITSSKDRTPFALLFIDLDNFKKVNDNAGHDAGDALLRHIANYLDATQENAMAFRPSAGLLNIAARIGGDEFIQIVSGIKNEGEAAVFAQNLLDMFASQMKDRYIEKYGVGMSIGIALFPYHTENFHVLIKYADMAMYESKRGGKNCYRVYNDDMQTSEESK